MLAADKDDAREALAWTEAFIADWFAFESEDDRMANQQWYAEWVAGQVDGAAEPT